MHDSDGPGAGRLLRLPGAANSAIVTWVLLATNGAVWLMVEAAGGTEDSDVLLDFGAMFGPLIAAGEYWRLFTAIFLHVGIAHLAFNAFGLFVFGPLVERSYGHLRFLAIYLIAGLAGSVASFMFNSIAIGAGASGAIFGVLGALAAFFLTQRRVLGGASQRNLGGLAILVAIDLVYGLLTPGIDNWAHMGGLVAGFAMGVAFAPRYRLLTSPFGAAVGVVGAARPGRGWWAVPVAAVVLTMGVWLAAVTLPDNAYSRVFRAERLLQEGDYASAIREVDQAALLEGTMAPSHFLHAMAEGYLLRGTIYAELGNRDRALSDLVRAVRYGELVNRDAGAEARERLVNLGSRR